MPYKIEKHNRFWWVVKVSPRKVMGKHATREKAERQIAAIRASENG